MSSLNPTFESTQHAIRSLIQYHRDGHVYTDANPHPNWELHASEAAGAFYAEIVKQLTPEERSDVYQAISDNNGEDEMRCYPGSYRRFALLFHLLLDSEPPVDPNLGGGELFRIVVEWWGFTSEALKEVKYLLAKGLDPKPHAEWYIPVCQNLEVIPDEKLDILVERKAAHELTCLLKEAFNL